ncbi:MAG TPA: adenine deaminase [Methanotrichaceae archaeon]|nr:adenine deaminase [Methanotrichaceae archaeon]
MDCLEELISAARCEREVDLLLEGAEIVNTLSGEVYRTDIAIHLGRIVGFDCQSAKESMDLSGTLLTPGFIDGHVHLESAMVTIPEYARTVVPKGTTSVVIDPHEIANVLGAEGIRYMLDSSESVPLSVFVMLPSCVPATDLETSGASLDAGALSEFMGRERVLGLAEMMNYPGVIYRNPDVLEKLRLGSRKVIDGHCPKLTGRDLTAYIAAGIGSDHECTSLDEAREKLRQGMHIMIREGSAAKNLKDLIPLVTPLNSRQFLFVSDDRHPSDILREGHLEFMIRTAIRHGLDPIIAVQIATINAAQYFRIHNLGAIAPGYRADISVIDDLDNFTVLKVIKDGVLVAEEGSLKSRLNTMPTPKSRTMNPGRIDAKSFDIPALSGPEMVRVIGIIPDQILTKSLIKKAKVIDGKIEADLERDILKMAVIERHKATGNIGLGLVSGFGLRSGAISSSVAHDSHNIAVVGVASDDMLAAANAVIEMGGGLAVVNDGKIKAKLALPIAGLLSERYMWEVVDGIDSVIYAARGLGCKLGDPFMTLSFLALPVIPELKLTDLGLVDVGKFGFVPLSAGQDGQ